MKRIVLTAVREPVAIHEPCTSIADIIQHEKSIQTLSFRQGNRFGLISGSSDISHAHAMAQPCACGDAQRFNDQRGETCGKCAYVFSVARRCKLTFYLQFPGIVPDPAGLPADENVEIELIDKSIAESLSHSSLTAGSQVIVDQWRKSVHGDHCEQCKQTGRDGTLRKVHGIELGHAFLLGRKYSQPFNVSFDDKTGQRTLAEMGCFGLGVTRIMAALVETHNDQRFASLCRIDCISVVKLFCSCRSPLNSLNVAMVSAGLSVQHHTRPLSLLFKTKHIVSHSKRGFAQSLYHCL